MKLEKSEQRRRKFFEQNRTILQEMAYRAVEKGLLPHQFLAICIDVDDTTWTEVVDYLMPEYDWQTIRDKGQKPVARGTVTSEFGDFLSDVLPEIAPTLMDSLPPEGQVFAVALSEGGASVFTILPTPPAEN